MGENARLEMSEGNAMCVCMCVMWNGNVMWIVHNVKRATYLEAT